MGTDLLQFETYPVSKYHDVLVNPDAPGAAYFMHSFGAYSLEGRILYNGTHEQPWVLSIHGARSDLSRADVVSCGLQARGYSVLSMTMSGHGGAQDVDIHATTLSNNITESKAFYDYLSPDRSTVLIAYSLGGTPALKVLGDHLDEVSKVILFYPGLYSAESYDKPYGEPFRSVLRTPYSYRDNDTIDILKRFRGDVMLIKGEYDGLDPVAYGKKAGTSAGYVAIDGKEYYSPIPKEVFDMITSAVPTGHLTFVEVPGCDHSVTTWISAHPSESRQLLDRMAAFLQK